MLLDCANTRKLWIYNKAVKCVGSLEGPHCFSCETNLPILTGKWKSRAEYQGNEAECVRHWRFVFPDFHSSFLVMPFCMIVFLMEFWSVFNK